jgi:hypothetical protein
MMSLRAGYSDVAKQPQACARTDSTIKGISAYSPTSLSAQLPTHDTWLLFSNFDALQTSDTCPNSLTNFDR